MFYTASGEKIVKYKMLTFRCFTINCAFKLHYYGMYFLTCNSGRKWRISKMFSSLNFYPNTKKKLNLEENKNGDWYGCY
jgi:hypothetical protein